MRKILGILALMMVSCIYSAHAQCDNSYYTLKEGTEFELTTFNKKDKPEARSVNTITSVEETSQGQKATVHTMMYDKKDKMVYEGDYFIFCENGMVKLDMKSMFENMMGSMQQSGGSDIDMTAEGFFIAIPPSLSVGDKLPDTDGNIVMKMGNNDMVVNTTNFHMKNREVIAKESLTTPAGTFDCLKIKQDIDTEVKIMMINRKESGASELWIAEGVGVVRSNYLDKKGKIESYTILTRYK